MKKILLFTIVITFGSCSKTNMGISGFSNNEEMFLSLVAGKTIYSQQCKEPNLPFKRIGVFSDDGRKLICDGGITVYFKSSTGSNRGLYEDPEIFMRVGILYDGENSKQYDDTDFSYPPEGYPLRIK
ncbi:MAG: hypothetical protein ACRCTQ_00775 [Brevinemataceae bacterium]